MAYVPGEKLQDPNDPNGPQPGASGVPGVATPAIGGVSGAAGSAVGTSPVAQSNATPGGAGTGFVNIDRYLGANAGAGQDVAARANKSTAADAAAFGAVKDTTSKAISDEATKKTAYDPSKLSQDVVSGDAGLRDAAVKAATDAVNSKFAGPSTVDYKIGQTDDVKRAQSLSNSATAGKQIAADTNTLSTYGTGLAAIDRAILGSSQEAPALQQAATNVANNTAAETAAKGSVEQSAKDAAAAVAQKAAATRQGFGDQAKAIQTQAQGQADAANAAEAAKQKAAPTTTQATGYKTADQIEAGAKGAMLRDGEGQSLPHGFADQVKKLPADQKSAFDRLMQLYPKMKKTYALSLAQSDPTLASLQMTASSAPQWMPGANGPAQASSFVNATGLNAIGSILGDESLTGAQQGPAFQGGHWEQPNVFDTGSALGPDGRPINQPR